MEKNLMGGGDRAVGLDIGGRKVGRETYLRDWGEKEKMGVPIEMKVVNEK